MSLVSILLAIDFEKGSLSYWNMVHCPNEMDFPYYFFYPGGFIMLLAPVCLESAVIFAIDACYSSTDFISKGFSGYVGLLIAVRSIGIS